MPCVMSKATLARTAPYPALEHCSRRHAKLDAEKLTLVEQGIQQQLNRSECMRRDCRRRCRTIFTSFGLGSHAAEG